MEALEQYSIRFLKWTERYTKTDMMYLTKGGFWLMLGQILSFGLSAILVWVFANFLSPEIYGTYKFVLSIFALVSISTLSGMGISIARAVAQKNDASFRDALRTKIKYGLLGTLVAFIGSAYYVFNQNTELSLLLFIIALFVPIAETFAEYHFYLQGKYDFKRQSYYYVARRGFITITVISAIILTQNIYVILTTYLVASTLINFFLYRRTLKHHPPNTNTDPKTISYGMHLSVMGILRLAATHLDKLLLFHFVGPALLAVYFFALAIPQELMSLFSQVNTLAFPKFVEQKHGKAQWALLYKMTIFIALLSIPVLLYILAAPFIFNFFFPQYISAIFYSQIFSLLLLFVPFHIIYQYFSAQKETRMLYVINFTDPLIFIISLLILLPLFGLAGAILSLFIRHIGNALLLLVLFIRHIYKKAPRT